MLIFIYHLFDLVLLFDFLMFIFTFYISVHCLLITISLFLAYLFSIIANLFSYLVSCFLNSSYHSHPPILWSVHWDHILFFRFSFYIFIVFPLFYYCSFNPPSFLSMPTFIFLTLLIRIIWQMVPIFWYPILIVSFPILVVLTNTECLIIVF